METRKVVMACFVGGWLGALVALSVNPMFWWLGAITGFVAGYLGYSVRAVIAAIPKAWRKAVSWRPRVGWWEETKMVFLFGGVVGSIGGLLVSWILVLVWIATGHLAVASWVRDALPEGWVWLLTLCLPLVLGVAMSLLAAMLVPIAFSTSGGRPTSEIDKAAVRYWFWRLNPVSIHFYTSYLLLKDASWCIRRMPRILGRFFWHLFRLVHSDRRLICGMSGATGATIGCLAGYSLVGGLVGVACGLLSFELVAKRWLKLVSATVSSS